MTLINHREDRKLADSSIPDLCHRPGQSPALPIDLSAQAIADIGVGLVPLERTPPSRTRHCRHLHYLNHYGDCSIRDMTLRCLPYSSTNCNLCRDEPGADSNEKSGLFYPSRGRSLGEEEDRIEGNQGTFRIPGAGSSFGSYFAGL